MDEKVEQLIRYITSNVSGSSIFLAPVVEYTVEATGLMDKISELWNIPKEEIGDIIDKVQEEKKDQKRLRDEEWDKVI